LFKNLFIIPTAVIFFAIIILLANKKYKDSALVKQFPELKSVITLLNTNESKALELINKLRQHSPTKLDPNRQYWLHNAAAKIYQNRLQRHKAIESYKQSQLLKHNKKVAEIITTLEKEISNHQKERNQRQIYRDIRNAGIAKKLKGEVVIAYIFVNDNYWSRWSNKDRLFAMDKTKLVTQWYKEQALQYDIKNLSFETRYFFLNAKRLLSAKKIRQKDYFGHLSQKLAKQQGYRTIEKWLEMITKQDKSKQVALIFHTNNNDRSFALPCRYRKKKCFYEHTQIIKKSTKERLHWPLEQTLAHEVLHLFGADDLYNIKLARNFATTDIMNYYSRKLAYDEITPVTAWAIGWQSRPKTPFILEN